MTTPCARLTAYLVLITVQWACQSGAPALSPDTADYFPIQTGQFTVYDVTEQRYSLTAAPVAQTYQLKETIGPAYTDVTGQLAYRLLRYRRSATGQTWQLDSVWSVRRTATEAIRTENGLDVVKFVFPATENVQWNANRLNASGPDTYQLRNVGQAVGVMGLSFDNTATVIQQADSTLLGQDKRREIYARDVGLVYKEVSQVQYCTATPGCLGTRQIIYGIQQTYQIRSYGRE